VQFVNLHKEHDTLSTKQVHEGLEESKAETALSEPPAVAQPEISQPVPEMFWLRWAYTLEFLVAIVAVITLWGEVGGEVHLDLIPWYAKLACILGWSWCCVRLTAGFVEQKKVWTGRTIRWLFGIILLTAVMGGITYYYHLHEEPDDSGDDTTANSVSTAAPGNCFYVACNRPNS